MSQNTFLLIYIFPELQLLCFERQAIWPSRLNRITYGHVLSSKKCTPGPWFVRFSLVHFSFVRNFKTYPKYSVDADFPLSRLHSLFVRKIIRMCIIDFICAVLVHADIF